MKKINIKGVSVQTWARTIVLLLALISFALFSAREAKQSMLINGRNMQPIFLPLSVLSGHGGTITASPKRRRKPTES